MRPRGSHTSTSLPRSAAGGRVRTRRGNHAGRSDRGRHSASATSHRRGNSGAACPEQPTPQDRRLCTGKEILSMAEQSVPPPASETDLVVAPPNAEALIAKAIEHQVPVETMERLLALRDRLRAEQARERSEEHTSE